MAVDLIDRHLVAPRNLSRSGLVGRGVNAHLTPA